MRTTMKPTIVRTTMMTMMTMMRTTTMMTMRMVRNKRAYPEEQLPQRTLIQVKGTLTSMMTT